MKKLILRFKIHFKLIDKYEYGICNNKIARRDIINGNVQFILWNKGEHGHIVDFWINYHKSWWNNFKK